MQGSTVLRMPTTVLVRRVQDEVVLLDLTSEDYFGLEGVGACVIEAIQAGSDVDGVVAAVADAFDGPEDEMRSDVLAFIDDLVLSGLLVSEAP